MFVHKNRSQRESNSHKGFTLIELTIGIAVLSIALLVMTGSLFPQAARSTDPWFQVRSAELAQSMMNEVLARKFDENSYVLGDLRCGEYEVGSTSLVPCAGAVDLTNCSSTEEASISDYDDVDDFNCLSLSGAQIVTRFNSSYQDFTVDVNVSYATNITKLIVVTVRPPRGNSVVYSAYKANY